MMHPPTHLDSRAAVVVVGLDCITGLQTARVFARRGVPVVGIASDPRHFGCRTRACSRLLVADTAGPEFINLLVKIGPSFTQKPVLVPCTDNSVVLLARQRQQLSEWYRMTPANAERVESLIDKGQFVRFASEHDLPVPKSFVLSSLEEAHQAATVVTYPVVLKPARKTAVWVENMKEKAVEAQTAAQLIAAYERYCQWDEAVLVQEWIPGPIEDHFTCDAYFDEHSQPLVTFTSQKLRQWPTETGVGTLSQACDHAVVRQETIRLFQAAGHSGFGYVEMKRHANTGEYLIIEPNVGRPTGRSACAEACGVELLYTMYCDLVGLPLPSARHTRFTGLKWIYWKRDLRSVWSDLSRGELTFFAWWRSIRGRKVCAVFSWRDPWPFFFDWVRGVKKRIVLFIKK